jgi:hypothetical protein
MGGSKKLRGRTRYVAAALLVACAGLFAVVHDGADASAATAPPTAPHVSAVVVNASQVNVSWTASSSAVGIANYRVIRAGVIQHLTTARVFVDATVTGNKSYAYSVTAVDKQGRLSPVSNVVTVTTPTPTAAQAQNGVFSPAFAFPIVAVHAALTSTGKVLTWQGSFQSPLQQYVFDPTTGTATAANTSVNMFCAGQTISADGRIVVLGGTSTSGGLGTTTVNAFNPTTATWQSLAPMHIARWYATGTTLSDGRILATSGYDDTYGDPVQIPEIYNVKTNVWTEMPTATSNIPVYPFMYQLPDGRVLQAGASEVATPTQVLNLTTQHWTTIDDRVIDGSSVINYAPGKFMKAGSAADSGNAGDSSDTAFTLDMNQANPTWQPTGAMHFARSFMNLTALPDGTVLATGGGTDKSAYHDDLAVMQAELWNPATGVWTTVASMSVPRLYHSEAILLPDGRVFISGSGGDSGVTDQKTAQLYSPPYMFKGTRPTITSSPAAAKLGTTPFIATPNAAGVTSVTLIRTASVTHSFDENSRAMTLPFTATSTGLNIHMPANGNIAPPGYYTLWITNSAGIPSAARYIRIPAPYETAPAAPTTTHAVAGAAKATVSWHAPASNGGSAVTGYKVTPYLGTVAQPVRTFATAALTDVVTGLTSGKTYTFKIAAVNAIGTGPLSVGTNAVKIT